MKRFSHLLLLLIGIASHANAQPSLQFFTNQANASLQAKFGFGVTHIPIYTTTNPAVSYTAALHYLLQAAADAYDTTTPAANFSSVFRPLFSWAGPTLYIVGYAAVTNDFYSQTSSGFKNLSDPTITTNDNVWGIPWVIGAKNPVPAFNEYTYSSRILVKRNVLFMREGTAQNYNTNRPPAFTNQFFILCISNLFGLDAWNASRTVFTNDVTIVVTNQIFISLTNNYNGGIASNFSQGGVWVTNSWPAWLGGYNQAGGFVIPLMTNTIFLPPSYWSERAAQFIPFTLPDGTASPVLLSDLTQTGWPVHDWILNITNNLMYSLIDNQSGRVLDYVNLGSFGSSFDITNQLLVEGGFPGGFSGNQIYWEIGSATTLPNSPMSTGLLNQIAYNNTPALDVFYYNSLNGFNGSISAFLFGPDINPSNVMMQTCTWQPINPRVHYTLQDLTGSFGNVKISVLDPLFLSAPMTIDLGNVNSDYTPAALERFGYNSTNGVFQMIFAGVADLPYQIWVSTNMMDWSDIGVASQPSPGNFQFSETVNSNLPARFFEVR